MQKELYIIEYESSQWYGGASCCVAWATSEEDALDRADLFMEESMRELFADDYAFEGLDEDDMQAYCVVHVQLLKGSEYEEYYNDPVQREAFYPCVN